MLIPVATEAAEDFIVRARDSLQLPATHIYVDTSLAMWLTAIGPTSRAAFIEWSSTLGDRLHVPAWTVHEYYRHHQSRTLTKDISKKCSAAEKALAELSAHMRIYADGPLVPGEPEMAFRKDLESAQMRVASATEIARKWDYEAASADVIEWMNGRVLSTTQVFRSFDRLKQQGSARYGHEVPPGFEDRHKGVNRYGDLIFWEDVVADARARTASVAVILTRDRKKDWFFGRMEAEVGKELRQLRGNWPAVPVPHPMLSLEMRSSAEADLLLIDEHYLGAIMWSTDKNRFGRLAAVTFGKSLEWLATATASPPGIAARASKRPASDTVSILLANGLIKAAKAPAEAPVIEALSNLHGEVPQIEEALGNFTPEKLSDMPAGELASLARRTYDLALAGPSPAAALARRLLDAIDRVDALHASAIVVGMLVGAYFDGAAVRERPKGQILQEVFEWSRDRGVARALGLLAGDLVRSRSPALYLPSSDATPLEVRIDASVSNTTTPVTVGQIFIGPQAVLVEPAIEDATTLKVLMLGAQQTTVRALIEAVGRHYGLPLDLLQPADAELNEQRTILSSNGVDRFDPYKLPLRSAEPPKAGVGRPASGTGVDVAGTADVGAAEWANRPASAAEAVTPPGTVSDTLEGLTEPAINGGAGHEGDDVDGDNDVDAEDDEEDTQ